MDAQTLLGRIQLGERESQRPKFGPISTIVKHNNNNIYIYFIALAEAIMDQGD